MANIVNLNRGSDGKIRFEWADADSVAIPIANPTIFDATPAIQGNLSINDIDLSLGIFQVFIEGTSLIKVGQYRFRVQATKLDGDSISSPEVIINVL